MASAEEVQKTAEVPWRHYVINGQYLFPPFIPQSRIDHAKSFEVRPTDVFIVTYPKAGTTLTQRIVHLIRSKGDLSNDSRLLTNVIPWFEEGEQAKMEQLPDPRIYKSHSPWSVVVRNEVNPCKYIYIARNPKDSCVSLFHHMRGFKSFDYTADWNEHFELFMTGRTETSSWFDHVRPWWQHRDDPHILFLKFEDMTRDYASAVRTIAAFIGVTDLTEDQVASIAAQSTFNAMKADATSNYAWTQGVRNADAPPFMRKGIVGDWRSYFSEDQSRRLDELYEKELGDSGLVFDYDA